MTLALPDVPRWVEAHGIANDPASWQVALGAGFAVGHDAAQLIVIAGDADPGAVAALARSKARHTILVGEPRLLSGIRTVVRAVIHTLADPGGLPDFEGAAPLAADTSLAHVPEPLADELGRALAKGDPVWSAWVDGEPVAFAYAPWRSARWFDVSVDTLAPARQLGLGTIVASSMIRDERTRGREPVWGADEDNRASLALAHRLGFEPVDELWIAPPT